MPVVPELGQLTHQPEEDVLDQVGGIRLGAGQAPRPVVQQWGEQFHETRPIGGGRRGPGRLAQSFEQTERSQAHRGTPATAAGLASLSPSAKAAPLFPSGFAATGSGEPAAFSFAVIG